MKRRGRKRKLGKRLPCGKLNQRHMRVRVSAKDIALSMPHRRGLKEPLDPLAESELGRMQLRGDLDPVQVAAGQQYARLYRLYMQTLGGPRRPAKSNGRALDCGGCLGLVGTQMCYCERRKAEYLAANHALADVTARIVWQLVICDDKIAASEHGLLCLALWALAQHFGLTKKANQRIRNAPSEMHMTAPPAER